MICVLRSPDSRAIFCMCFSCSFDHRTIILKWFWIFWYLLSVFCQHRRNTRVHRYKEIIEKHLRSFIRHFCLTLFKINMTYLAASRPADSCLWRMIIMHLSVSVTPYSQPWCFQWWHDATGRTLIHVCMNYKHGISATRNIAGHWCRHRRRAVGLRPGSFALKYHISLLLLLL